ncbi:hypothetical protein VNI00_004020 [Paramarasmius palmivorus]|uniref:Uncharacterized protein n=1 Tax=Paramarasmius palmivorus TaxID=297713 RepID=A0AAW0DPJ1_9AGAR
MTGKEPVLLLCNHCTKSKPAKELGYCECFTSLYCRPSIDPAKAHDKQYMKKIKAEAKDRVAHLHIGCYRPENPVDSAIGKYLVRNEVQILELLQNKIESYLADPSSPVLDIQQFFEQTLFTLPMKHRWAGDPTSSYNIRYDYSTVIIDRDNKATPEAKTFARKLSAMMDGRCLIRASIRIFSDNGTIYNVDKLWAVELHWCDDSLLFVDTLLTLHQQ